MATLVSVDLSARVRVSRAPTARRGIPARGLSLIHI